LYLQNGETKVFNEFSDNFISVDHSTLSGRVSLNLKSVKSPFLSTKPVGIKPLICVSRSKFQQE